MMKQYYIKTGWKKYAINVRKSLLFIILLTVLFIFNTYVVRLALVSGESMYPTLMDGDLLIVNQVNYEPSRGDIILIDISESPLIGKYIVKRVIAIEGDTVSLDYDNNSVLVNGEMILEPYLNFTPSDPMMSLDGNNYVSYQVPSGTVFVMGDNRNNSIDSRNEMLGMVEKSDITGKVSSFFPFFRYFR